MAQVRKKMHTSAQLADKGWDHVLKIRLEQLLILVHSALIL